MPCSFQILSRSIRFSAASESRATVYVVISRLWLPAKCARAIRSAAWKRMAVAIARLQYCTSTTGSDFSIRSMKWAKFFCAAAAYPVRELFPGVHEGGQVGLAESLPRRCDQLELALGGTGLVLGGLVGVLTSCSLVEPARLLPAAVDGRSPEAAGDPLKQRDNGRERWSNAATLPAYFEQQSHARPERHDVTETDALRRAFFRGIAADEWNHTDSLRMDAFCGTNFKVDARRYAGARRRTSAACGAWNPALK